MQAEIRELVSDEPLIPFLLAYSYSYNTPVLACKLVCSYDKPFFPCTLLILCEPVIYY